MADINLQEVFAKGTGGNVTCEFESTLPFVVRGITKKHLMDHCAEHRRDCYYIDTGYLGNFPSVGNPSGKKLWHRIVRNKMQHDVIRDVPTDRWKALVKQDPRLEWKGWKKSGNKILLVLPNPKACNSFGINCEEWIKSTTEKIKQQTDMPIEIREKGSRVYRNHEYSIYDAFDSGVYATVSFNSIASLESVLYGIPSFVAVPCAASPLASTDLSQLLNPFKPDETTIKRQCYNLAYGQFTIEEMTNGAAWNILKNETTTK